MRRWLAIFLLTLLPLQFSWAAAAGYCAHESRVEGTHLGHHQHEHVPDGGSAAADLSADEDGRVGANVHPDCGQCHGLGVGLPMPLVAMAGPVTVRDPAPSTAAGRLLRATAPPDRPQWPPLA